MRAAAAALVLVATAATARADAGALAPVLKGEVNVVAFWSIACAPCKDELPFVEALYQKYKADPKVRVVVVNIDEAEDAAAARKLTARMKLTMPQLTGAMAVYEKLFGGEVTIPRLAVIDRKAAGLERNGAVAGEKADAFVRDVTGVIESLRAGAPRGPTTMWAPLGR